MERIAIVGLGLMGASLGLALKKRGYRGEVVGFARDPAKAKRALARGVADRVTSDLAEAVSGAGVVVLCTPVLTIPRVLAGCRDALRPGAVVTDVGSTKSEVQRQALRLLRGRSAVFVGSHPIAGSEKQGLGAARVDLYEDAAVIVTPPPAASPEAVRRVCRLWEQVGGRVAVMPAGAHDAILARTSHLPHLVSVALARAVARPPGPERVGGCCGSGFRDVSRLAEGSPDIWVDILATNRTAIVAELKAVERELAACRRLLQAGDPAGWARYLEKGRFARRSLLEKRASSTQERGCV